MKHFFYLILLISFTSLGQILTHKEKITRQDTLRGSNTEFRNGWDVQHYALSVEPDLEEKNIKGVNIIDFVVTDPNFGNWLQIDLQEPMKITQIKLNNKVVTEFRREGNVYFISTRGVKKTKNNFLEIGFEGKPRAAVKAPWDGGWIFESDKKGRPFVSVTCQGLGASVWFPNKDYLGDEPDKGITLELTVPHELTAIAAGKLISKTAASNDKTKTRWKWEVVNPINSYSIIPYIGYYENFKETYKGEKGNLELDFYALDYNIDQAKEQFKQTRKMLACFEEWFGPYPFYEDGYKLVEVSHLGMEHQSAIAYGNQYQNGYFGNDLSGTGIGLLWDFIIIHESGHEWFGNNITAEDIADMWIHESFTAYSEAIYSECLLDKDAGHQYITGTRKKIQNDVPMIGLYGVNRQGSIDMYYKGANMIHTIRTWLNDDVKFKEILRDMNEMFYHQTVTTKQIEEYFIQASGLELEGLFDQYLRTILIPELEYKVNDDQSVSYRYTNVVNGFKLPLRLKDDAFEIHPTSQWKTIQKTGKNFAVSDGYYIEIKRVF